MNEYILKLRQAMTLKDKIRLTQQRIQQWVDFYGIGGICII